MSETEVFAELRAFMCARDWEQFHSEVNLAKSISIEAAELLELFQWSDTAKRDLLEGELADVLTYCFLLAQKIGKTPEELILQKLSVTGQKYPVEKARGTSEKYDQL